VASGPRRRYTKREKAAAVATATMTSTEAAAESTGIPESTIRYWMDKPEFAELRTKTRDQVADEFWSTIQLGLKRLVELIPQTEDLQKVSVSLGILYDKHALLTGGATGRTESRDLTGSLADGDLISAVHEAESIASSRRAETADQEPAEA
jgi:transposase-like protein